MFAKPFVKRLASREYKKYDEAVFSRLYMTEEELDLYFKLYSRHCDYANINKKIEEWATELNVRDKIVDEQFATTQGIIDAVLKLDEGILSKKTLLNYLNVSLNQYKMFMAYEDDSPYTIRLELQKALTKHKNGQRKIPHTPIDEQYRLFKSIDGRISSKGIDILTKVGSITKDMYERAQFDEDYFRSLSKPTRLRMSNLIDGINNQRSLEHYIENGVVKQTIARLNQLLSEGVKK